MVDQNLAWVPWTTIGAVLGSVMGVRSGCVMAKEWPWFARITRPVSLSRNENLKQAETLVNKEGRLR